ncbi:MAG: MarR family transcriptional regulator [Firmicutes bacterium]|jgi:DNA-binding MarR family transcriptional regulator|nr:MarR family transcriptional regulator [Bacillota bacterium]
MKSNQIRPGSLKAADLSDQLNRPRPAITRILNALEERGLIVRTIDPDDRRSINISLTEEGGAALQKANDTILKVAERIVLSLGESETEKLIQLLGRLTDIFEDILGEAGGNSDE